MVDLSHARGRVVGRREVFGRRELDGSMEGLVIDRSLDDMVAAGPREEA